MPPGADGAETFDRELLSPPPFFGILEAAVLLLGRRLSDTRDADAG